MVFEAKNNAIRLASKFARLLAVRVTILTLISILMTPSAMLANCQLGLEAASHLDAGFDSLYDLNFNAAQAQFSGWKARYPNDPLGSWPRPRHFCDRVVRADTARTAERYAIVRHLCRGNLVSCGGRSG